MIEISVTGLQKSFDLEKKILDGLTFQINSGERVGLLGKNGAGKTTLFRILTGEIDYDAGEVAIASDRRVGLISQIPVYPAGYTVEDVLQSAFERMRRMADEMERLSAQMAKGDESEETLRRYGELSARFEGLGGYDTATAVNKVANGLSIPADMRTRLFDTLSGGEKTRVNLGRLILEDTDILLLDEPTNHLDIPSREALEAALLDFGGTMLVVSHDRYFINKLSTRVLSIGMGGAESFDGGYDDYAARIAEQSAEKPKTAKTVGKGGEDYKRRKERESELRRTATAIKRCEERINELDELIANTNAEMSTPETAADYARVMELTETLGKLNGEQTELMLQWEELENRKAQLEGEE